MIAELTTLGRRLEIAAAVVLWIAVVLRAPSSIRRPRQRGLWLAVATAATAMTLSIVPAPLLQRLFGTAEVLGLATNLFGVVSAGAVLDFVMVATGRGRRRRCALYLATAVVIAVLVVLDRTGDAHALHAIHRVGLCHPGPAYWLLLIGTHLTADAACTWVCCHYARRSASRPARRGLWLFGLGTAFSGLYWSGQLLRVTLPVPGIGMLLPYCMVLHGLLRAGAVLVPVVTSVTGAWENVVTVRRLWPLWRDVTELAPHVVLVRRRSRLSELLRPQGSFSLLQYRKVIEIRDALLVLSSHSGPEVPGLAEEYLRTVRTPLVGHGATVLACLVRQARRAALDGLPPGEEPSTVGDFCTADLCEETSFLVEVATAYTSPAVRGFNAWLARRGDAATALRPPG
ncbi:MAB_1171c family putative transporter [Streptomyces sp. NPDC049555]|uniref:MAB_1171c family putative transporter n=1 Tax=unclassified Streptomyces TaxID=2593676 RepID=UPI003444B4A7